jgi:diguanylate cyclase (GGDEF)-like protein/PAS domain S-box-containing protein
VVVVGYAYSAPLLYGGTIIPVALPTAIAFVLVGTGQMDLAGHGIPALRAWNRHSMRGILLRAFLPSMLFFILLEGWLNAEIQPALSPNPAVWHSLTALVAGVLIVAITGWIARRTGGDIERAQAALNASEERYRRLFEAAQDGILIVDAETGMVIDVNPFLIGKLGFSREQFRGKTIWELGFLKDVIANRDNFAELLRKEYIRYEDLPLETADGRRIDVEFVSNVYQVDHQKVIQCNIRDITERKRAEVALRESEEIFSRFMQHSPIYVFFKDEAIRAIRLSSNYEKMLGKPVSELLGKTMDDLFPSDLAKSMIADDLRILREGKPVDVEEELDGRSYSTIKFPIYHEGEARYLAGFTIDITERKRAEQALQQHNRELALLNRAGQTFNSTLDLDQVLVRVLEELSDQMNVAGAFWMTDPVTGELVCRQASGPYANTVRGWRLQPGQGIAGWVAQQGEGLIVPDALADARHYSGIDGETGVQPRAMLCVPLRSKDQVIGVLQLLDTEVGRFSSADLRFVESLAATATIALENARLYDALHSLSLTDELTGLRNRRGFMTLTEQELKVAQRTRRRMFLFFIDLDGLKQINDTLGHAVGDAALLGTAHLLQETFRTSDILARLGGDEFGALMVETAEVSAPALTARLQKNLAARNARANRSYQLSLSVGITRYDPESPCTIDELLARADEAMYEEKKRKRKP